MQKPSFLCLWDLSHIESVRYQQLHSHHQGYKAEETAYLQVSRDVGTSKDPSGSGEKDGKDGEEAFTLREAWPKVFCKYGR